MSVRRLLSCLCVLILSGGVVSPLFAESKEKSVTSDEAAVYELRIYTPHPGKFEDMLTRFRDHTCDLFVKHGMTNVAYFATEANPDAPADQDVQKLVYFLKYPSREARDASWKAFLNDPEWKAVYAKSHEQGPVVKSVESQFMTPTDYSPAFELKAENEPRLFELRTYLTGKGRLEHLHDRFRDHTISLFQKHGMTNVVYFDLQDDQPGAETTLIYLIAHKDKTSRDQSFADFRQDPVWIKARTASEEKAGGSLTIPNGVKSLFLYPTDFSPVK